MPPPRDQRVDEARRCRRRELVNSINVLDRPVVVAYMIVIVTFFILINLAVDLLYSVIDPRIRLASQK